MQLVLTPRAMKDLGSMPKKDREAILGKLESFASTGTGDVKKLTGNRYFRLRHGDWRAIFEMQDDVLVLRVLHRREAYE